MSKERVKDLIKKIKKFFSIHKGPVLIYMCFTFLVFIDFFCINRYGFISQDNITTTISITIGIIGFFVTIGVSVFQDNYDYGFRSTIISQKIKLRDLFIIGLLILGILFFSNIGYIFLISVLLPFLFWNIFAVIKIFELRNNLKKYLTERKKYFNSLENSNSEDDYKWDQLNENINKMIVDKNFKLLSETIDIFQYPIEVFFNILHNIDFLDTKISKIIVSRIYKGLSDSFKEDDYRLFEDYYTFTKIFFRFGRKFKSELFLDRSWRYGKEYITQNFLYKNDNDEYFLEKHKKISEIVFKIFSSLLKEMYDIDDFNFFKKYIDILNKKIVDPYIPDNYSDNFIFQYRDEIFFGLISWFLYKKDKNEEDKFRDYIIQYLKDKNITAERLTSIFVNILEIEDSEEDKFGWEYWYISDHTDEGVFSMSVHFNSQKTYLYLLDKIFVSNNIELDLDNNMDNKIISNLSFIHFCDEYIKKQSSNSKIKNFFTEFIEKHKIAKKEDLINSNLDDEKIASFKENIISNFTKYLALFISTNLFIHGDSSEKLYELNKDEKVIKYLSKEIFIDSEFTRNIYYVGLNDGFNYGRVLIINMIHSIFEKIEEKTLLFKKDNMHSILDNIENPVIVTFNGSYNNFFRENIYQYNFKHIHNKNNGFQVGVYKYKDNTIRVFNFNKNVSDKKNEIFVLEENKLGKFYVKLSENEISIEKITRERLEKDVRMINITNKDKENIINSFVKLEINFNYFYKNDNENIGWRFVEN